MKAPVRLFASIAPDGVSVRFDALFPAPDAGAEVVCAPATLELGDGEAIELGVLCAPTQYTWRSQCRLELAAYRYRDAGPYTATLHWGETAAAAPTATREVTEAGGPQQPSIALFQVLAPADDTNRRRVKLHVAGLASDQRIRLDGGAGQVMWLSGADGSDQQQEWALDFPKAGRYTVAVDLTDDAGFWQATLAETPVEIIPPLDYAYPGSTRPPSGEERSVAEPLPAQVEALSTDRPWLPYRYFRPTWGWTYLYTQPGGPVISRTAWAGTYLSARAETSVGGERWFLTAGGDWVAAGNVTLMEPSELRGVELGGVLPPPSPPPTPPPAPAPRRGVVTADVLNVRAQPGVRADNPPIDRLTAGTEVGIYEESSSGGAVWYRIGEGRWVHSGWVRLIESTPPPPPADTRRGVVTADVLNVRAQPGVRPENPPIGFLYNGAEVTIYEDAVSAGATWYRIGESRWVHSGWVRIVTTSARSTRPRAAESALSLPLGWIVADALNVRARPGVTADNPPLYLVRHNQIVPVLQEADAGGSRWYRIGDNQWVAGAWVGVARPKPRPSIIGVGERWVGVNLKEQTVVAYEGDRPVYAALAATGLPGTPTVQGIFRTWARLDTGVMAGPGYYLEDVTWTCYFYSGYGLHTTYWHDAFGRPRSHGCVNLSPYDAWWIYQWSAPGGANSPAVYVYWS